MLTCVCLELFYGLHAATGYATPHNPTLRARVTWNRVRSAEVDKGGRRSRVLLVSGPPGVVNRDFLCRYLDTKMVYQLDEVIPVVPGRAISVLEWRFGSYRCQAQAAWEAFRRNPVFAAHGVTVRFDRDPCDYSPWGW